MLNKTSLLGRFDVINFFYGIGAAVVLMAAMFKFIELPYADEMFMIGLSTEAVIFIVSAFNWKRTEKRYSWEKVFPQLEAEMRDDSESIPKHGAGSLRELTEQEIQVLFDTLEVIRTTTENLNIVTRKLTGTVESMNGVYTDMSRSTAEYSDQIKQLQKRVAKANDKLNELDRFNF